MGLYSQFETDANIERDGVWVDYVSDDGVECASFLIARSGGANTKFAAALTRMIDKYRLRSNSTRNLPPEKENAILIEVFANHVILDWKGVTDRDGAVLEYSKQNVIRLMTDLPVLFDELRNEASKIANYRVDFLEDAEKNLPNTSDGSSKSGTNSAPSSSRPPKKPA